MKIIIRILFVIIGLLFVGGFVLGEVAEAYDGPMQSFRLLNTSKTKKSVTFEWIDNDGNPSNIWSVDEVLEPNYKIIKRINPGRYIVKVWDEEDNLLKEFEFQFELENPEESNYNLYRFDLAMDKYFTVIDLNAVYEGNSLAESLSTAVGTNKQALTIKEIYKGDLPFLIPETITNRTFVELNESIPSRIKFGEIVYGLFAVSDTLNESEMYTYISEKLITVN